MTLQSTPVPRLARGSGAPRLRCRHRGRAPPRRPGVRKSSSLPPSASRARARVLVAKVLGLNAFAIVLLTLLGAAGESLGMDRHLKVNTAKHRTHSLFRQGCMLYELIPNMPEFRLRPLIARFGEYITQNRTLAQRSEE